MTEAKATLRYVRMSPRKTRPVVDLIRGCPVSDALALLRFTPRAAAKVVQKVLLSAVANGQQPGKELGGADSLRVSRAWVDVGPTLKRFQPRARSEEHTSELQSQSNLVCRLLLEKKKKADK